MALFFFILLVVFLLPSRILLVAEVSGLRSKQCDSDYIVFYFVLRRPETSATERLEALELQAQRLRAQYHLSAV